MFHRFAPLALVFVIACDVSLETDTDTQAGILWNALPNGILWNSLTGTPESITELTNYSLSTETFDAEKGSAHLSLMINDPNAQTFMHYLVSCALDSNQSVTWEGETWTGAAGLCTDWNTGVPSKDCLELVSACLIARNNKHGKSVQISPRGEHLDGSSIELLEVVPVKPTDEDGEPIPSLEKCGVGLVGPNCGYSRTDSLLGRCTPSKQVTLKCGGLKAATVRACEGVEGCSAADAITTGSCPGPAVQFDCPVNGVFGVMQRPTGQAYNALIMTAIGADFPGSEFSIYGIAEGAFFGNLFASERRSTKFTRTVEGGGSLRILENFSGTPSSVIYTDAWACNDPGWGNPSAYMHDRLCAIVTPENPLESDVELCVATALGECGPLGGNKFVKAVEPVCKIFNAASKEADGDYDDCIDGKKKTRRHPITVYLDHPCAISNKCERID